MREVEGLVCGVGHVAGPLQRQPTFSTNSLTFRGSPLSGDLYDLTESGLGRFQCSPASGDLDDLTEVGWH